VIQKLQYQVACFQFNPLEIHSYTDMPDLIIKSTQCP